MTPKFLVEYAAVLLLDAFLRCLSWEATQAAGAFFGRCATMILRRRWKMTLSNVAAAFPEKTRQECAAIALQAWENAGRLAAEFTRTRHLSQEELKKIVRLANPELCDRMLAEGKGLIVNIGHLGNWETGGVAFTAYGYPLGVVGRAMKNPWVDAWMKETRERCGETVFSHRNPFFQVVKWLKRGKMTAILIDHNIPRGGIFVPFFGRPAATSTLGALLAVKIGCPILSCRVHREGSGLVVTFTGPLRPDPDAEAETEAERLTLEMTKDIEGYVRQRPGEWLWGHNRWKRTHELGSGPDIRHSVSDVWT